MAENIATSMFTTFLRGTSGIQCEPAVAKPKLLLQLYDMENCPYCRIVREVVTELGLDAEIYPCPTGGTRFRSFVQTQGGKSQFPFLIDPNNGAELYESMAIIEYLFETYALRPVPLKWKLGPLQKLSSTLAGAPRAYRGMRADTGQLPQQMLELFSFEGSPYARPVRELLCEMEIPYVLRSVGRTELEEWLLPPLRRALNITPDSKLENRQNLQAEEGQISVPYLFDPNTDTGLFESAEILAYLESQYRT
ncbi:MAG: glutathione S-transferase N-terminal domain-containing protein [Halioglobus sp.]